jgi:hypothetical protein
MSYIELWRLPLKASLDWTRRVDSQKSIVAIPSSSVEVPLSYYIRLGMPMCIQMIG